MSQSTLRFARPFDLHAFHRTFPDRCAEYWRASGKAPAEIALEMGVDPRTARNWLDGVVTMRAQHLAVVAHVDPGGFKQHFNPLDEAA